LGDTRLLGTPREYEPLPRVCGRGVGGWRFSGRYCGTYPRTTRQGGKPRGSDRGRVELTSFLNENTLGYDRAVGPRASTAGNSPAAAANSADEHGGERYVWHITSFDDIVRYSDPGSAHAGRSSDVAGA
jgi:hypothetical protein